MRKYWLIGGAIVAIGAVFLTVVLASGGKHADGIHYHAGFRVYVDNQIQDFSDLKYMKMDPCGDEHEVTASRAEEQLEKAHLHDLNGDVVHVHRNQATWGDLFINMTYAFPEAPYEAYVNGVKLEDDILDQAIQANDSVVVLIGANDDVQSKLASAVPLERIQEVEALSENCGVK